MAGILMLPLLIIVVLILISLWNKRKISFGMLASNKVVYIAITLYVLAGVIAFFYVNAMKSDTPKLTEQEVNEFARVNDQLYTSLSSGNFDQIDEKYVAQQTTYEIPSKQFYIHVDFPEDLSVFVKYVDKDSDEIKVTTYSGPFALNNYDVSKVKGDLKILQNKDHDLYINVGVTALTIASVDGSFPLDDILNFGGGFSTIGSEYLIAVEVPKHIEILNHPDEFRIIK